MSNLGGSAGTATRGTRVETADRSFAEGALEGLTGLANVWLDPSSQRNFAREGTRAPMEWEIVPYQGVGPVRFGMGEAEVIAAIGQPKQTISEWKGGGCTLHYPDSGVFVYIGADGRCHTVACRPPRAVAVVDGTLQLAGDFEEVVTALDNRGYDVRWGSEHIGPLRHLMCDALGITVKDNNFDHVGIDSVAVFSKDEYQGLLDL